MLALVACALGLLAFVEGDVIVYTQTIPHTIADEFRDMPASFGSEIPPDGLRGYLTIAEPSNACSPINKPPASDNFTKRWIVLIARYNCSFEVKIRNAQAAGYDCAIVHNVDSNDLETMSAKNSEGIDIPSVFVTAKAGFILSEEYLYTNGYYIMVNGDPPFNINTHLLLPFAIVVALCLVVMLIFMIVKCVRDRRRARRHRLPSRALKKIPTCKFSKGDPYDTCAICLDDYQEGDRLRVLPCAHAYHAKCIDPWLTQNRRVCPVCKRRVLAAGERRAHSDSDEDEDDSREPLVAPAGARAGPRGDPPRAPTQGGTFEEQSENPFVRAARFMSRLRGRSADAQVTEDSPSSEENDQSNINEGTVHEDDSQPLIRPTVTAEAERRPRRMRRQRSANSPRTRARDSPPGGATAPAAPATPAAPAAPTAEPQPPPLLHSADHSINRPSRGEIGVAALPAPTSHHVDL